MPLTYTQQLADPRWQKRRLEMLQLAGWSCSWCSTAEKQLHVHHPRYVKGRMAWEYGDDELQVLCVDCHKNHHTFKDALASATQEAGYGEEFYSGIVAGFLEGSMDLYVAEDWPACPDARLTGRVAYMFFHSNRQTKESILRLLADSLSAKSPVDEETFAAFGVTY